VLSLHKLTPPAMRAILDSGESRLDGVIGPGHVTTVIGSKAWEFVPRDYGLSCVVAGFEPLDVLQGIYTLVERIESQDPHVDNAYVRSVRAEGNQVALDLMYKVFEVCAADWRGIGSIPDSGLALRSEFRRFDARERFDVDPGVAEEPAGCICGDVIRFAPPSTPWDRAWSPARAPVLHTTCTGGSETTPLIRGWRHWTRFCWPMALEES
jgi:hydrogenase expression/formation protein HypD